VNLNEEDDFFCSPWAFIGNEKPSFASSKEVQAVISKLNLKRRLEVRESKAVKLISFVQT